MSKGAYSCSGVSPAPVSVQHLAFLFGYFCNKAVSVTGRSTVELAVFAGAKLKGNKTDVFLPFNTGGKAYNNENYNYGMKVCRKLYPLVDGCNSFHKGVLVHAMWPLVGIISKYEEADPVDFLLCYSDDLSFDRRTFNPSSTDKAVTQIAFASYFNIPVYNLAIPEHYDHILKYVQYKYKSAKPKRLARDCKISTELNRAITDLRLN